MKEVGRFAFTVHPFDVSRIHRRWPITRRLPDTWVEGLMRWKGPVIHAQVPRLETAQGAAEGWLIGIPLTARQWTRLPDAFLVERVLQAARLAARLGARILGLGAYTALPGGAGVEVARRSPIAITTGNSLTVWAALEGAREGARRMGIPLDRAEVAVIGASGAIGSACARILARSVRHLTLIGRDEAKLERVAAQIREETGLIPDLSTDIRRTLPRMDVVITVSSTADAIVQPEDLKPGAVVCDVAMPRDVDQRVAAVRDDVLVVDGGLIQVPGKTGLEGDGFPPGTAPACLAETMLLALEGRYEHFTLGRDLSVAQIDEIVRLARKHGFTLAGIRSFHRALDDATIEAIRRRAALRRGERPEGERLEAERPEAQVRVG
ncbi:MAG: shikimate dehydrogenase [Bacillota bacterium]